MLYNHTCTCCVGKCKFITATRKCTWSCYNDTSSRKLFWYGTHIGHGPQLAGKTYNWHKLTLIIGNPMGRDLRNKWISTYFIDSDFLAFGVNTIHPTHDDHSKTLNEHLFCFWWCICIKDLFCIHSNYIHNFTLLPCWHWQKDCLSDSVWLPIMTLLVAWSWEML